MTDPDTLQQTRDALEALGRDNLAENLDEQLEDDVAETRRVVELLETIESAEAAGLGDDPAVEALREQVEALRGDAGLGQSATAPERMADEFDLNGDELEALSEADREELRSDLEAIDEIGNSRVNGVAAHELRRRRDSVDDLLDERDVAPADLVADDAPIEREELAEALTAEEAALVETSGSTRGQVATLRDAVDDIEEQVRDAETAVLLQALREEKERLQARLEQAEAEV